MHVRRTNGHMQTDGRKCSGMGSYATLTLCKTGVDRSRRLITCENASAARHWQAWADTGQLLQSSSQLSSIKHSPRPRHIIHCLLISAAGPDFGIPYLGKYPGTWSLEISEGGISSRKMPRIITGELNGDATAFHQMLHCWSWTMDLRRRSRRHVVGFLASCWRVPSHTI